jgi:hypothetical protein
LQAPALESCSKRLGLGLKKRERERVRGSYTKVTVAPAQD